MIAASLYVTLTLIANYSASWFVPMPIFGLVSLAVLAFAPTFTIRDYVHRLGRSRVYLMIGMAAAANVALCVMTETPWRIIVASFTAILVAEGVDTEFYHRLRLPWLHRVAASNAISIPLDSLLFNGIAFAGEFEPLVLLAIIWGEIVIKTLIGWGVAVPRWVCLRSFTARAATAVSQGWR